jgi:hypothetical protein
MEPNELSISGQEIINEQKFRLLTWISNKKLFKKIQELQQELEYYKPKEPVEE